MTGPTLDLVGVWTIILGAGVFFYVLLDGFDLGAGMLYGLARKSDDRAIIMNSIAPVWDGNETWLILGVLGLMAVFPLAFAIIIPAIYFPVVIMLLALIFRGVAFEFRFKDADHRGFWDLGFFWGSLVATFAQGCVLGAFVQGFHVVGRQFVGGSLDWLTPFSVLTGVALMAGYTLLGAGWLVLKTSGPLQDWARKQGRRALAITALAIAAVSLWTPLAQSDIRARWFSWPNIAYLAPVPLIAAILVIVVWRAFGSKREVTPFAGSIGLFAVSYLGLAISLWPNIVPHRYSLWDAAASESTQAFLLVGTLALLPVILMYTGWSYWVFRGKVSGSSGYH